MISTARRRESGLVLQAVSTVGTQQFVFGKLQKVAAWQPLNQLLDACGEPPAKSPALH